MNEQGLLKEIKKMWDKIDPEFQAIILAIAVAIIRVIYDRKETHPIRIGMEAVICGLLTKAFYHAVLALNLNLDWAIVGGGIIGFLGTYTVRAIALRFINRGSK